MGQTQVWDLLFKRLQSAKTAKYVRCFLVFISHFVWRFGAPATAASADTVQPGIFLNAILPQVSNQITLLPFALWLHCKPKDPCCALPARICQAVVSVTCINFSESSQLYCKIIESWEQLFAYAT